LFDDDVGNIVLVYTDEFKMTRYHVLLRVYADRTKQTNKYKCHDQHRH